MDKKYNNKYSFSYLLSEFLTTYLQRKRNLSKNTIHSYATNFKLFLQYCINEKHMNIRKINFDIIDRRLIEEYLDYIEKRNSINTRNQRLAAIKSFYQYVVLELPTELFNGYNILKIPKKRTIKDTAEYFSQEAISVLFKQPDISTKRGRNDFVILTTLYDTACRITEFLNIKLKDLHLGETPYIDIQGKGRKKRIVTIRKSIKENLEKYIYENKITNPEQYLFSHNNKVYTRQAITTKIAKYINNIKQEDVILPTKYTPHIFRHSKAMHLLENGASLEEIQDYLGHESMDTTKIYAKYNIEQQKKALEKASNNLTDSKLSRWHNDSSIIEFLNNL